MSAEEFPIPPDTVVTNLAELFRHQGEALIAKVLENSRARIEETEYDSWDGGTHNFTLCLEVPLRLFAELEPNLDRTLSSILKKLGVLLATTGNRRLNGVQITPILDTSQQSRSLPKSADDEVIHIWEPGLLRLFLSHVSAHRMVVARIKNHLRVYGVSSFVAHEDIEPSLEWQGQIELALRSMNALVALLTPDFKDSQWTDHEVGFGLGRGTLVIPVTLGLTPYGFIGKQQALWGDLNYPLPIASSIVDILLKHRSTADVMYESLVVALESAPSFAASKSVSEKLEKVTGFSSAQLNRLQAACTYNDQVSKSWGVPEAVQRTLARHGQTPQAEVPNVDR